MGASKIQFLLRMGMCFQRLQLPEIRNKAINRGALMSVSNILFRSFHLFLLGTVRL